jgi:RIO kinase 1
VPDSSFEFSFEESASRRRGRRRFDHESTTAKRARRRRLPPVEAFDTTDGLPEGDRWSTWDRSTPTERGPKPRPDWLVTELAAVDTELGVLKTGKEADVFLLRRGVPGTGRSCLLAAKRYRSGEHRMFHRDSGYLEGRRTRESRVNRAMSRRSGFGREAIAEQWARAEFAALARLHVAGVPVPYPVQILGTEVLLEFIGSAGGAAAPRLAETRPGGAELAVLWDELVQALVAMARDGLAHGDLSAYNLLVHAGRLVMIDLPQVVDVIANPRGAWFLTRDAENVARWFAGRGLSGVHPEPKDLAALLRREAMLDRLPRTPAWSHGRGPTGAGRRCPRPERSGPAWRRLRPPRATQLRAVAAVRSRCQRSKPALAAGARCR